ncbi:MAG: ABC transporter substrate-binding protein [Pararhodobacter sp.]|nr:ABC transporter substrate-binding protein [Pararhodobacter sp.]
MNCKQIIALGCVATLASFPAVASDIDGRTVCVNRYASAPVIDEVVDGLRAGLAEAGGEGVAYNIQNPEADAATQQIVSQQFAAGGCDVIITVGTAATQAIQQATSTVPVVFLAVSTPVESGLIEALERPGGNITGVSDPLPVEAEVDGMLAIKPSIRTIGLIYRVGDAAGDVLAARARTRIEEHGLAHVTAGIANAGEVTQAAQSLVGRVDAIQFPCDTTTMSGVVGALAVVEENGIPAFGCTTNSVQQGAVLAGSYNYHDVGRAAGALAAQVLRGADPAETPIVVPEIGGFELNATVAEQLGLTIPQDMLDNAFATY